MNRALLIILFLLFGNQILLPQDEVPLYDDSIPNQKGNVFTEADNPTLTIYLPSKEKSTRTGIIVVPGGAYSFLAWNEEGIMIAKEFSEKGITAFVLKYRLPSDAKMRDKTLGALMDAEQAIKNVRDHAKEYNVDANRIGIIGFSAGGHLASSLGTHYSTSYIPNNENTSLRPDFMILAYPVISMDSSLTHKGSRRSLLGTMPPQDSVDFFSNEKQVTKNTPPTYLTHAKDDKIVSYQNSVAFYVACIKNGVPAEIKLVDNGDHGFTQRLQVNEWMDPMLEFLKEEGMYKEKSEL